MTASIPVLEAALAQAGDEQVKTWWENYVVDANPFFGVKMPTIRKLVQQWVHDQALSQPDDLFQSALDLLRCRHSESKLAGVLLLQEHLLPKAGIPLEALAHFAALFDENQLNDWNICDWFCVKVLGPGIANYGDSWASCIGNWSQATNLWRARASLVGFVKVADQPDYDAVITHNCAVLIQRPERFSKTAVGWILRELSKRDAASVEAWVSQHLEHFTLEVLNNALKYAAKSTRQHYKAQLKSR